MARFLARADAAGSRSGAEDSQLWGLCLGLLSPSLQGQEPSGEKGLGGPKDKVIPVQGHFRLSHETGVGGGFTGSSIFSGVCGDSRGLL